MSCNEPEAPPATSDARDALEAATLRKLLAHLAQRSDVQNIDLMILAGFCRNCLADWYQQASADAGTPLTRDAAREHIYGMPFAEWKAAHQTEASAQQLADFAAAQRAHGKPA